jgi:hypothetical protein
MSTEGDLGFFPSRMTSVPEDAALWKKLKQIREQVSCGFTSELDGPTEPPLTAW